MTVNAINPNTPEVKNPEKLAKGVTTVATAAAGVVSAYGAGMVAAARIGKVAAEAGAEIGKALAEGTLRQGDEKGVKLEEIKDALKKLDFTDTEAWTKTKEFITENKEDVTLFLVNPALLIGKKIVDFFSGKQK